MKIEIHKPREEEEESWEKEFDGLFFPEIGSTKTELQRHSARKDFIRDLLSSQRAELLEKFKAVFFESLKEKSDNTFDKTIKGKKGWWDVSDEDWQGCHFTFEELWEQIYQKLKR